MEPMWERVNSTTERLEVPGGWLYRHYYNSRAQMCFVPTPVQYVLYPGTGTSEAQLRTTNPEGQ